MTIRITHVGPAPARRGGPAGYLWQLARALEQYGSGPHHVALPPLAPSAAPRVEAARRSLVLARRARRTLLGPPSFYRPPDEAWHDADGQVAALIADSWRQLQDEAASSLAHAVESRADVLFTHDCAVAEAALGERRDDQQVWLFLHNPMPLGLYLAWSWGTPEKTWEEIARAPDVSAAVARELAVIARVDRLLLPCAEAGAELARVDRRFAGPLRTAMPILTGGAGPARMLSGGARELRRRFDLPERRRVGLFLGTSQPYRGFDLLCDAIDCLPRSVAGVIAVAGCPQEEVPWKRRLKPLGFVQEVADLLAAVDFVINVNRFSLFDLSTIEAFEAGKPALMTPTGGNLAFARLGGGVRLSSAPEAAAIADALGEVFDASDETLQQLSADSTRCYARHLTLRQLRDRHVELYDSVAAGTAAHTR